MLQGPSYKNPGRPAERSPRSLRQPKIPRLRGWNCCLPSPSSQVRMRVESHGRIRFDRKLYRLLYSDSWRLGLQWWARCNRSRDRKEPMRKLLARPSNKFEVETYWRYEELNLLGTREELVSARRSREQAQTYSVSETNWFEAILREKWLPTLCKYILSYEAQERASMGEVGFITYYMMRHDAKQAHHWRSYEGFCTARLSVRFSLTTADPVSTQIVVMHVQSWEKIALASVRLHDNQVT